MNAEHETPTGEDGDVGHSPDREPTAEEEATAERVAADVDLSSVSEHEREMAERGANAKGEGAIE